MRILNASKNILTTSERDRGLLPGRSRTIRFEEYGVLTQGVLQACAADTDQHLKDLEDCCWKIASGSRTCQLVLVLFVRT